MTLTPIDIGKGQCLKSGKDIAILSLGKMRWNVEKAIELSGYAVSHYDMRFVKPLDTDLLDDIAKTHKTIVTVEDGVVNGGFGESVQSYFAVNNPQIRVKCLGIPDEFIGHGSTDKLFESIGLGPEKIAEAIKLNLKV
jgi:1-deoxy-D-xylulose-5-phosphate synthase